MENLETLAENELNFELFVYKKNRNDGTTYFFDVKNQKIRIDFNGFLASSFFIEKMEKEKYNKCNYTQRNYNARAFGDFVIFLKVSGKELHTITQECSAMKKAFKVAKIFYSGAKKEDLMKLLTPWQLEN